MERTVQRRSGVLSTGSFGVHVGARAIEIITNRLRPAAARDERQSTRRASDATRPACASSFDLRASSRARAVRARGGELRAQGPQPGPSA